MRIVVTGGGGFIGRNLRVRLSEAGFDGVTSIDRGNTTQELTDAVAASDFIFHLAGVNRPEHPTEFDIGNRELTASICNALRQAGKPTPIVFTSSTQASLDNLYGQSKRAAELELERYAEETGARVDTVRLTNVFGKWSRPNYNSVVATFCYNLARGLPITIADPTRPLRLVYIDDVVETLIRAVTEPGAHGGDLEVGPVYETTVGLIAETLRSFASSRVTGMVPPAGQGLARALFGTYASFIDPTDFGYALTRHADSRGVFAEMIKTQSNGQVSFFSAHPGVTRGGHYHHTKTEKFLVVAGRARFGFRQILTGETREMVVSAEESRVVETVPGWAHDITNVGDDELIVVLWANELFDPLQPDTVPAPVVA